MATKKVEKKATKKTTAKKLGEDILIESLDQKPPKDNIKQREQGGRTFSYLEGWYVKKVANEIFGPLNWTHEIDPEYMKHIPLEATSGKRHGLFYCPVTVTVTYGDKTKKTTEVGVTEYIGEYNIETAIKGSATDGLKRGLTALGNAFGLNLYDSGGKEDTDKDEDEGEGKGDEDTVAPTCHKCGETMAMKSGSAGDFWACPGYPECKNTYDPSQVKADGTVTPRQKRQPVNGPTVEDVKGEDEIGLEDLPF